MNCSDRVLHNVATLKVNVLSYVRFVSDSAITDEQDSISDSISYECGSSSGEEAEFHWDVLSSKQSSTPEEDSNLENSPLSEDDEAEF